MTTLTLSNGAKTIVDPWDFGWACWIAWYPHRRIDFYVCTNISMGASSNPIRLYLHRLVANAPAHMEVDHINHDKLDNRFSNLRIVTRGQNMAYVRTRKGTSRFKGVHWQSDHRRWVAKLKSQGRNVYIGEFSNEIEAALAYNEAAKKYHGEFAVLNEVPHA